LLMGGTLTIRHGFLDSPVLLFGAWNVGVKGSCRARCWVSEGTDWKVWTFAMPAPVNSLMKRGGGWLVVA
jgi:hypothetical protein